MFDENDLLDLQSWQIECFYDGHLLGEKDATEFLIHVFIASVDNDKTVHPLVLKVINEKLKLIAMGEDSRKVFPSFNEVGKPKSISLMKRYGMARSVELAITSGIVSNQLDAFSYVADEKGVTEGQVESAYREHKKSIRRLYQKK